METAVAADPSDERYEGSRGGRMGPGEVVVAPGVRNAVPPG